MWLLLQHLLISLLLSYNLVCLSARFTSVLSHCCHLRYQLYTQNKVKTQLPGDARNVESRQIFEGVIFWKKGSSLKVLHWKNSLSFMFYSKNSKLTTITSITQTPLSYQYWENAKPPSEQLVLKALLMQGESESEDETHRVWEWGAQNSNQGSHMNKKIQFYVSSIMILILIFKKCYFWICNGGDT